VRIELPTGWVVLLNVAGWPVLQFGLAWLFTRMLETPHPPRLTCGRFNRPGVATP
jgi:hypothetical protein